MTRKELTLEEQIERYEDDREKMLDEINDLTKENEELQERVKELEDLIDDIMYGIKSLKYIDYR